MRETTLKKVIQSFLDILVFKGFRRYAQPRNCIIV